MEGLFLCVVADSKATRWLPRETFI